MNVHDAVRSLRSTRDYGEGHVPDEAIVRWVEAARWCGSSKNTQPWRLLAIRDRAMLKCLADLGHHSGQLRDCSVAVAVAMRHTAIPFSSAVDLGRICQSLMLLAHEDGYGSCIAVLEPQLGLDRARTRLGIPNDHDLDIVLSFGTAAPEPDLPAGIERVSPRGRLAAADLLSWEQFGTRRPMDGDRLASELPTCM